MEAHDSTADECFSGACAVLLLFVGRRIFVANAGTARAVLVRQPAKRGQSLQAASLSAPHTLDREDERERVVSYGRPRRQAGRQASLTASLEQDHRQACTRY